MKLTGKTYRKPSFSTELASFCSDEGVLATLKEGAPKAFRYVYELRFSNESHDGVELIVIVGNWLGNRFKINGTGNGYPWRCVEKKWYDIFLNSTSILRTHLGNIELQKEDEKFQLYSGDDWVGTVKKVYEDMFDKGEYMLSFDPKMELRICLVISSIFVIENEVLRRRNSTY